MIPPPPRSTRTDTLFPYTTLFRSCQISLPSATAVSLILLEKPHSLSYQVRIRTKVSSSTWVWVRSKVELAGEWLKSLDTSGSSLTARMPFRRLPLAARSEEHTSELQSLMRISYAVFCLKKKNKQLRRPTKR